ncbi:MAG: tail fiber domain-containing protein [Bacteroidota bacterium]
MKVYNLIFLLLYFLFCSFQYGLGQSVGISPVGSNPDASAILDVESTSKGMLIPRMSSTQRQGITSPATGLMVYDVSTDSFWFFDGGNWTEIQSGNVAGFSDQDGDTRIRLEANPDDDVIRFQTPGSEYVRFDSSGFVWGGEILPGTANTSSTPFSGGSISIPDSGAGVRMMWIPNLGAFRAGSVENAAWELDSLGIFSFAGGGENNQARGRGSFIGGGRNNQTIEQGAAVVGGVANAALGVYSTVIGGSRNELLGTSSVIIGGTDNTVDAFLGGIMGGRNNGMDLSGESFILGGAADTMFSSRYSGMIGGVGNVLMGDRSAIIGGQRDTVEARGALITGGNNNKINFVGEESSIIGGTFNKISAISSTIAGGIANTIKGDIFTFTCSFIGGGFQNDVEGTYSAIVGGSENGVNNDQSVVVGGFRDSALAPNAFVAGGSLNKVTGTTSAVVGGAGNTAAGDATFVTGIGNTAPSWGEVVIGTYAFNYTADNASGYDPDDRIFTVGNGTGIFTPSNAFTVFKNGNAAIGIGTSEGFRLKVKQNGNTGINLENSGFDDWEWFVTGSGGLSLYANAGFKGVFDLTSGAYTSVSDARLKSNIQPLPAVLPAVMQLNPKSYTFHSDQKQKTYMGFLAQELAQQFPQAVHMPTSSTDKGESYYTVDYSVMSVVALKAIQEQQAIIDRLQEQLEAQQSLIQELLDRVDQ